MRLLWMFGFGIFSWVAEAATELQHGLWYQQGQFVAQTWYEVDGKLTRNKPAQIRQTLDLNGGYVVPPFAEAHNHNLQNPWLVQNFHQRYLQDGVLYGLMMCGNHGNDQATKQALAQLPMSIDSVGACISSSDGHPLRLAVKAAPGQPDLQPAQVYDSAYIVMDTPADIAKKWPLFKDTKARWVKIILVHSEQPQRRTDKQLFGLNGLAPEVVRPLVSFLHQQGLKVTAHVESAADFALAVEAGVDLIAHLPGYQWWQGYAPALYRLSDASIAMAAQKQIAVIATAGISAVFYQKEQDKLPAVQALQRDNLQRLKQAGVQVLVGSDRFDANVLAEVNYLQQMGVYSNAELLQLLVSDTPRFLFPGRAIGALAEGHEANLLVLHDNPLKNWQALSDIQLRMWQGKVIQLPPKEKSASPQ
ncbi:hypothetical protein [Pseudomonas aeruginosa]|uniref:amidohydrolase family protein n=1 Tax=Pseudomonas aeruginosa TaxID=287 RepID=UPI0034A07E92